MEHKNKSCFLKGTKQDFSNSISDISHFIENLINPDYAVQVNLFGIKRVKNVGCSIIYIGLVGGLYPTI